MDVNALLANPSIHANGLYNLDEGEYAATLTTLAEWGDAKAQHNLAAMYLEGVELPLDYEAAFQWHFLSAEQGYAPAQHDLGTLYLEGLGVAADPAMAATWFLAAARQNDPKAQNNLGILYATGDGVEQNLIQARAWFLLAARGGEVDALENLLLSAEEMDAESLVQADLLAEEWAAEMQAT
ncbi:MAG: sel1 repeat family protein [Magnetococcales bacterium]|nr:sel1 repeat family protein [Magnetococcales bacterium]NGZ05585.1 sel1 repeat family protein [Magnetococcales bacterium]